MKGSYKLLGGRLTFEVVGNAAKDVWEQLSQIQELFEAETCCGLCQSQNLRYRHRKAGAQKEYDYYELVCKDCNGRFDFGQSKDKQNLFPKRKDHPETRGWYVYDPSAPEQGEGVYEEEPPAPSPQRQPAPQQQRQSAPQQQQRQPPPTRQVHPSGAAPQQQRQAPTAGSRHNASDLPYEAPPPRGGYR